LSLVRAELNVEPVNQPVFSVTPKRKDEKLADDYVVVMVSNVGNAVVEISDNET
jgi:hypothetical protein